MGERRKRGLEHAYCQHRLCRFASALPLIISTLVSRYPQSNEGVKLFIRLQKSNGFPNFNLAQGGHLQRPDKK